MDHNVWYRAEEKNGIHVESNLSVTASDGMKIHSGLKRVPDLY